MSYDFFTLWYKILVILSITLLFATGIILTLNYSLWFIIPSLFFGTFLFALLIYQDWGDQNGISQ